MSAPGPSFSDALEEALDRRSEGAPLAVALTRVRAVLPMADNLGISGDDRDLYQLVDRVTDGVRAAFPESLCRSGCSACCHYPTSLFNVTGSEWEAIVRHVETAWEPERLERFRTRFWREHGPYMRRMRVLGALVSFPLPVFPRPGSIPPACPFLEDDRCSIYPARPTHCRAFGHFTIQYWWRKTPFIYGCLKQIATLKEALAAPGRPQLPSLNPLDIKLWGLARGKARLLALWTARTWPEPRRRWFSGAGRRR